MIIKQKEWFSIKQCIDNPKNLYIFGDNTLRVGKGGQAQIRDCINSFGICTKVLPEMTDESFFNDVIEHLEIIEKDIFNLKEVIKNNNYEKIIFPCDGLGSGLSDMPNKCPLLYRRMNRLIKKNFGIEYK